MGVLQNQFESVMRKEFEPAKIARLLIERELNKRGIKLGDARAKQLEDSVDEMIEEGKLSFELTEEELEGSNLTPGEREAGLSLRPDLDAFEKEMPDIIHRVMMGTIDGTAEAALSLIERETPDGLADRYGERMAFEKRLEHRWGKPLDTFDLFRAIALEAGSTVNEELSQDENHRNDPVLYTLLRLHARACQIASEIAVLLRSGLADGAHARWRTLHEIAVVAQFIKDRGADVATRYVEHEQIEAWKAAREYQEKAAHLGLDAIPEDEMRAHHDRVEVLVKKYGTEFKTNHGWAAAALGNKDPKFSTIENGIGLDHLRPYYRLASHNVHANPKGAFTRLGLMADADVLLAGPSNAGLVEPAHSAAASLGQVTVALLTLEPDMDRLVTARVLIRLRDQLGNELGEAREQLERDEAQQRAAENAPGLDTPKT